MTYIQRVIQGWFRGKLTRQETAIHLVKGLTLDQVPALLEQTPEDILRIITDDASSEKILRIYWIEADEERMEKEKLEYRAGLDVFLEYMKK